MLEVFNWIQDMQKFIEKRIPHEDLVVDFEMDGLQ